MMNRRNFLAGVGAGLLAPRLASAQAPFVLGIGTYTYRGVTIDEMIDRLKALEIRHLEISTPGYFLPDVTPEKAAELGATLDRAGIAALSYYCGTIKTESDLDLAVKVAKALGAGNLSGDAVGDALTMIDARFTREKLTFGIHNHFFHGRKFEYESPEDVLKALAGLSDAVGATMDAGHMASCGYDPVEALAKLRPHLKAVHLKDVERAGDDKNVVLGTGVAKSAAVVEALKKSKFTGLVAIEYEEGTDPQADVARCVEFARQHG